MELRFMAKINEKVMVELENIEIIIREVEELNKKVTLNKYEINSAALYLHNFYNGMKNILIQILKDRDLPIPKTANWHKDLLTVALNERILTDELYQELLKYLSFRHFVSHSYTFKLDFDFVFPVTQRFNRSPCQFSEKNTCGNQLEKLGKLSPLPLD